MAKGQRRSNREAKKPKQPKTATSPAASRALELTLVSSPALPQRGRDGVGDARPRGR